MIHDWPELVAEVAQRADLPGLPQRAAMIAGFAERELNQRLRVAEMEQKASITAGVDGEAVLPADFLALRQPAHLAMRGDKLVDLTPGQEVEICYYAALPSVAENGSNWLLASDPEIYLYALLQQVFLLKPDAQAAADAAQYLRVLIDRKSHDDRVRRYIGQPLDWGAA